MLEKPGLFHCCCQSTLGQSIVKSEFLLDIPEIMPIRFAVIHHQIVGEGLCVEIAAQIVGHAIKHSCAFNKVFGQ